MSIIVLCELRPHPDEADATIQGTVEQLSLPSRGVAGRRSARLYQHVDDPARLLYLAEWDSREVFDAYRRASPMRDTPDQLERRPECRIYRRLALFERVLMPVSTIWVDVVDGPPDRHADQRDLALTHYRSSARSRPDLILLHLYEAVDAGPGLLIISGWERTGPLEQGDQDLERDLLERLVASGGTLQRFVGRPLAETSTT